MKYRYSNTCYSFLWVLLLAWQAPGAAQTFGSPAGWHATVGLNLALGYPVTRVGCLLQGGYIGSSFEMSAEAGVFYFFHQYGPPVRNWEAQTGLGLGIGLGDPVQADRWTDWTRSATSKTPGWFGVKYHWNRYWNAIQTSQYTGSFDLRFGPISLLVENDFLTPIQPADQFRSGAVSLSFQTDRWQLSLQSVLWHGQTRCPGAEKVQDPAYPGRWGYRDFSGCLYGDCSHGVLALQGAWRLPYGQSAQIGIGIDAERIRHFLQNQLVHDMYWAPSQWVKVRNLHYPMLDSSGKPYLFEEDTRIRPARLYWLMGLNNSRFY